MNIVTEEERVKDKNRMKGQFFWPGTEGQRDAGLNLSDTALFGQETQGHKGRPLVLAQVKRFSPVLSHFK